MNESEYEKLEQYCHNLKISVTTGEIAKLTEQLNMSTDDLSKLCAFFQNLDTRRKETVVSTCLKLSRLPLKEPKTFDNFDFSILHSKDIDKLKNLITLYPLYEHKNIAFIGPQGIGKTHLAMAFGRACCELGIKTYFLKATELNQKITMAIKNNTIGRTTNGLVKPGCLIIDEIGRCTFDEESTKIFFDIVDKRIQKEGPNCMIFTSNKSPDRWRDDFKEEESLLCALDRIFDNAIAYMMDGDSYRGRKLETVAVRVGGTSEFLKTNC